MTLLLDAHGDPTSSWAETPGGLLVPDSCRERPLVVDLFAGCGGFSLGFHQAGYHVIAAVEMDAAAVITYAVNLARPGVQFHYDTPEREEEFEAAMRRHLGIDARGRKQMSAGATKDGDLVQPGMLAGSGWIAGELGPGCEHIWVADTRNLTGREILDVLGVDEVAAVIGGPPCQGFSTTGKRDVMDPRNSLVFDFCRLAMEMRAQAICMENVPGMLSMTTPDGIPVIEGVVDMLESGGFGPASMLRRALTGKAGARGVVRRKKEQPEPEPPTEDDAQLSLLETA